MPLAAEEVRAQGESHASAKSILQANGLKCCAGMVCKSFGLHTLHDIGGLSQLQLNSVELEASLKSRLKELVVHCADAETYKAYRKGALKAEKSEACARHVHEQEEARLRQLAEYNAALQNQKARERRDAVCKTTFLPHER
jgi:hypothetical protein